MGLYSSNRFSNLVCENTKIDYDGYKEDIVEAVDVMTACSYLSSSLSEMAVDSGVVSESTDSDKIHNLKEEVINKIKQALAVTEAAIEKESADLNGKVKSIYTADKNIFTKYAECILSNKCDFTSFSGIKNFVFPAVHIKESMEKVKDTRASLDAFNEFANNLSKATTEDIVDSFYNLYECSYNDIKIDHYTAVDEATDTEKNWIPTNEDVITMLEYAEDSCIDEEVNSLHKTITTAIMTEDQIIKETIAKLGDTSLDLYKAQKLYEAVCKQRKYTAHCFNESKDLIVREVAALRKSIVTCGKYSSKQNISAADNIVYESLGEASDTYVYEYFRS